MQRKILGTMGLILLWTSPVIALVSGKAGRFAQPAVARGVLASIYVYHTDAEGVYTPDTNDSRNSRLRGYMRTDAQGRYEYSTIKPAPYPSNNAPGYQGCIFEIVSEGDPKLSDDIRARAAQEDSAFSLVKLTRDAQGVWHCTQDIKLRKS